MELKEFITETIMQIIEGVEVAQKNIVDKNIKAIIQPKSSDHKIETIKFDVAITTIEKKDKSAKGGINVASILSLGEINENSKSEQNLSRIQFNLQIQLPNQENDNYKKVSIEVPNQNISDKVDY